MNLTFLGRAMVAIACLVLCFAASPVSPAHADSGRPYASRVIYLENHAPLATWPVYYAAWSWAKYGDVQFRMEPCRGRTPCIHVYHYASTDGLHGKFVDWYLSGKKIRTDVYLNARYQGGVNQRRATTCHELGHALGLDHRSWGQSCMRGMTGAAGLPDAKDYWDLSRLY